MLIFYVSCALAVISLIEGSVVLIRNVRAKENILFFLVALLASVWSVTFAAIELPDNIEAVSLLNKFAYFFGGLLMLAGAAFTYFFPRKITLKSFWYYLALVVPVLLLSFSELIAGKVSVNGPGYVFEYGKFSFTYVFVFIVGVALIVANTRKSRRLQESLVKSQADTVMLGYSMSLIIGILLSVVIPALYPSTEIDNLAPASVIFMLTMIAYAIIKHKLFDFKAVIVRSLSYVFAVSIFTIIYVSVLYLIRRLIFPNTSLTMGQLVSNVGVGLVIVATFPFIKRNFDKYTKRLFFRDAYDPQALLSELNRSLVSDAEIESLLTKTALVIQENFKATFCTFYIRQTSYFPDRFIGAHRNESGTLDLETLSKLTKKTHKKVHCAEVDPENEVERELNKVLKQNEVEVLARLVSTVDYEVNGIGLIFIGPKKSGSLYSSDDLKIIEIIVNELVIAIENLLRFEEIEQFNVTLQKKIDDATKELQASNDKLKALDEAKDEFVSMASHQLRTPLTSVKGYISMVLEGDAGKINDTQKQMLGQALFSSQRMVYLISDLLNVSRLKTGKFVIESKPIFLPDLVESEMSQLYEGATAKNITLQYAKPKKFTTVNLDEMKIRQVVMNFTDNAIYYTPNGGKITVELKDKKDSIEFTVKDTGIGVPKAERHKLFEKFYRAENARKARPDGTGLGLFMAKKVIVAQGGSILFDSKEGKGSTFGFSFPKKAITDDTQVQNQSGTLESNQTPEKA